MSPQPTDNTVLLETVSGRDYAEVFAAAAAWFADSAQTDVVVWGINLDGQGPLYVESDDLFYLELFYQRFDRPRLVRETLE